MFNHEAPTPANKRAKHQPVCNSYLCNNAATVLFKDDPRNSDTWHYGMCDVCGSHFCADCAEVYGDENGEVTCGDCAGPTSDELGEPPVTISERCEMALNAKENGR